MSDIKITIGGDIRELQTELAKAGGATTEFANKAVAGNIKIGGSFTTLAQSGQKSIFILRESLKELQAQAFTEKDIGKIKTYNAAIASTQGEIKKLESAGTSSFGKIGAAATGAFSQLRNLAYVLPGIGIAGILSAFIGPVVEGLSSLGEAFFGTGEEAKAMQATITESIKGFAKATATVSELTAEIDLAKKGFIDKDGVVKHYNETIGKTTGLVKNIEEAEAALIAKGPAYIKFMLLKAAATFAFQKSAELAVQALFIQTQSADGPAATAIKGLTDKLQAGSEAYKNIAKNATTLEAILSKKNGFNFFDDSKIKKETETIASVLAKLQRQLQLLKVEGDLFKIDKTKEQISAIEAAIKHLVEKFKVSPDDTIIKKLFGDIDALNLPGFLKQLSDSARKERGVVVPVFFDEFEAQRELADTLEKLIPKGIKIGTNIFGNQDIELKNHLFFSIESLEALRQNLIEKLKKLGVSDVGRTAGMVTVYIPLQIATTGELQDQFNALMTAAAENAKKQLAIYKDTIVSAFTSIGESIGNAVLGKKNFFGSLFAGLLKSLGAGMKQLGEQAVVASTLIVLIRKTVGQISGIGAGIALIAAGVIIQGLASKIQGASFASGVRSFGGGFATVGERGPERVFLPSGASVQPNNEVNAFGGGGSAFIAETRISGQDLIIMLARAQKTMDRNN